MSKPRLDESKARGGGDGDGRKRKESGAAAGGDAKRAKGGEAPPLFAALAAVTDPNPTPARQVDLAAALLDGLAPQVKNSVAERLFLSLEPRAQMALFDKLAETLRATAAAGAGAPPETCKPRQRFKSLAKAIVEFKRNELGHRRKREGSSEDDYALSEEQLRQFFVDDASGMNIFDSLSPRNGAGDAPPIPATAADGAS